MREVRMQMTEPQARFFQLQDKHPLFCGGYGAGKTETMLACAIRDALEAPKALIGLYEPTYDLVRMILAPRLEAKLTDLGIKYRYNKHENMIRPLKGCGSFVMRTMDNPGRIVGYETARAHIDEIDTLPREHAEDVWRKIIARNRQIPKGSPSYFNRVSAYTTPEGFKFAYDMWVRRKGEKKKGSEEYVMIQAPTASNPWLPADYIPTLRATYPAHLVEAYLMGRFVNMTTGAVYPEFSRELNHAPAVMEPQEHLHIGMDFNVNKMAAVVFVIRQSSPIAVAELIGVRDTPDMARLIKQNFVEAGHQVTIYPDASGANTSSKGASESDLSILSEAGFYINAPLANPRVKDRVNAVNALILNGRGERRMKVNTATCPKTTEALEQQTYDEHGEPDKEGGHDHPNDALGYFLNTHWPVVKNQTSQATSFHMER